MGILELTAFINNRKCYENYELHDCYLVLDGSSVASQLHLLSKKYSKCHDCFGGDYDKFASEVQDFFQLLSDCNVEPLIVIDGGYESKKVNTIIDRMKNRIETSAALCPVSKEKNAVFPIFRRDVFMNIAIKRGIKCFCSMFEADADTVFVAKSLNCPVLSFDSDFYIFDCLYIPFPKLELKLKRNETGNYISCKVFNVDKFLMFFEGFNKINLPLLSVLLGNDYIAQSSLSRFYESLTLVKPRRICGRMQNKRQRLIETVIVWLKDETLESALRKILSLYRSRDRKKITDKIQTAFEAYQTSDTGILQYFNIESKQPQENQINLPKLEEIQIDAEPDDNEELESSSDDDCDESAEKISKLPEIFKRNLKKCIYPSSFIDLILNDTYYCTIQVEDLSSDHSHTLCLNILQAIHKILISPSEKKLICVARCGRDIQRYTLPIYEKYLPNWCEIQTMALTARKRIMFEILNIVDDDNLLTSIPESWDVFMLSLVYWVKNSNNYVDLSYVYSVILCAIIINYVDAKIGFHRSSETFLVEYKKYLKTKKRDFNPEVDVEAALNKIDKEDSIQCLKKLITYFEMDVEMKENPELYDKVIVHQFSCLQACLLHTKDLNILLELPYPNFTASDVFDGTFLYNLTAYLKRSNDSKSTIEVLLKDCPTILNSLNLIIDIVLKLTDSSGKS